MSLCSLQSNGNRTSSGWVGMPANSKARMRGFTMVELMVVLAIAGILAALAAPRIASMIASNQLKNHVYEVQSELSELRERALQDDRVGTARRIPVVSIGSAAAAQDAQPEVTAIKQVGTINVSRFVGRAAPVRLNSEQIRFELTSNRQLVVRVGTVVTNTTPPAAGFVTYRFSRANAPFNYDLVLNRATGKTSVRRAPI